MHFAWVVIVYVEQGIIIHHSLQNAYSAGKLKPMVLKEVLIAKTQEWEWRHGTAQEEINKLVEKIDGPGIYVFKHKEHQCFQVRSLNKLTYIVK